MPPSNVRRAVRSWLWCYAKCGTEISCGATLLLIFDTEIGYGATLLLVIGQRLMTGRMAIAQVRTGIA
eukprot:576375-Rhodomonas_salina.1